MPTDSDLRSAMAATMAGFHETVAAITTDDWARPSPCDGWTVFDVVDHVIAGDRFAVIILGGGRLDEAIGAVAGIDHVGSDPTSAATTAATAALAAFDGSLDRLVDHPVGLIPARRFLGFRLMDQLGHTWDVAAGRNVRVQLDPAALAVALEVTTAERETLDGSANFAMPPEIDVDLDDPQSTFLHMIGRSPGAVTP